MDAVNFCLVVSSLSQLSAICGLPRRKEKGLVMPSDTKIASSYKPRTKVLAITNVVAVLCYLIAASLSWVEPERLQQPLRHSR